MDENHWEKYSNTMEVFEEVYNRLKEIKPMSNPVLS